MKQTLTTLRDGLTSLRLTVMLLLLGIILVFAATIDQTNLGVWGIQQKWFRTFVVIQPWRGLAVPVFPGGYLLGGLLLLNLVAAHLYRFKLTWRRSGIFLTHAGFILLLVGELLSGLWQEDFTLRLSLGETKNYAESYRYNELALSDVTSPTDDHVVAILERILASDRSVHVPQLPFRIEVRAYFENAELRPRTPRDESAVATRGLGLSVVAEPASGSTKKDSVYTPAALVELSGADGEIGTFLVSTALLEPQEFTHDGRTWRLSLRPQRVYWSHAFTLLEFSHQNYEGTDIPRAFTSCLKLAPANGGEAREVRLTLNNPLRYEGFTYYQAGFENNDHTTVIQVVRNPSWMIPYIACGLMAAGLLIQFGLSLVRFLKREEREAAA